MLAEQVPEFFHQFFLGVSAVSGCLNRRQDIERHPTRFNDTSVFGHDRPGSVNDNRHDRCARVDRQHEWAFLKGVDGTVRAPGSFRKNQNRCPVFNRGGGFCQALKGGIAIGTIDADISATAHGPPENGNPEKLGFGQPPELHRQVRQQHRDVEVALVICHKDGGTSGVDVRRPVHRYVNAADKQDGPGPQPADKMRYIAGLAEEGQDNDGRCQDQRR